MLTMVAYYCQSTRELFIRKFSVTCEPTLKRQSCILSSSQLHRQPKDPSCGTYAPYAAMPEFLYSLKVMCDTQCAVFMLLDIAHSVLVVLKSY